MDFYTSDLPPSLFFPLWGEKKEKKKKKRGRRTGGGKGGGGGRGGGRFVKSRNRDVSSPTISWEIGKEKKGKKKEKKRRDLRLSCIRTGVLYLHPSLRKISKRSKERERGREGGKKKGRKGRRKRLRGVPPPSLYFSFKREKKGEGKEQV